MFQINDKITYNDEKNNNVSIGKITRVLRNNNVIVKKVSPLQPIFFTKIKTTSIICNHSANITNNKKTDNSRSLLEYQELLDKVNESNLFFDLYIPIFITTIVIISIIMTLYNCWFYNSWFRYTRI
jgi:hypothetical protein